MRYKLILLLIAIMALTYLTGCAEDSWWHRHHHHHDDRPEIAVQIR